MPKNSKNPSRAKLGWAQRNQRFRSGNIFHIGARNFTEKERKFIAGKMWFNFAEMFYTEIAPAGTLDYLKDFVKTVDNIYISIDIDAIEPAFAPGTGWPEPAGILPWQMIRMLQFLKATKKVRGFDIVEVSPPKDVNKITSRLAARLLLELLK
ncbi:MAG: arginase family protein [DPANN group archaeon]|nr:arginase family protein [DPANN group archaeon]